MRRFTIGLVAILILAARSVEAEIPYFGSGWGYPTLFRTTCRALVCAFSRRVVECIEGTSLFAPHADDGGGGDGGDGSGGDGGASDSGGDAGGDSGDGDAASGDTGAVGDPSDPGNSENSTDTSPASDPTDPSAVSAIDNTVPDVPTNDPALGLRGPGSPGSGIPENVAPVGPFPLEPPQTLGGPISGARVNVGINAVIVSGAPTPWEAVGKGPGVQNVTVTGGIIALGEAATLKPPLDGTFGTADGPPEWLRLRPDSRYLNGSVFPPVVPNVIDIRTISNTEEVIENPSN